MDIPHLNSSNLQYSAPQKNVENLHADFCDKITNICKPLNKLRISYFHFIRSFPNNSRVSLSNNRGWSEYYYSKKFYQTPVLDKNPKEHILSHYLWGSLDEQLIFNNLRENFNIDHGITIVRPSKSYCDFYYFASTPENKSILNFYLNSFSVLEHFNQYFIGEAMKIIKTAEKDRIFIPETSNLQEKHTLPIHTEQEDFVESFMKVTPLKKYKFIHNGEFITFSFREMECIQLLLNGETAKSIASLLKLSPRTVESYLMSAKQKIDCHYKTEFIKKFKKLIPC